MSPQRDTLQASDAQQTVLLCLSVFFLLTTTGDDIVSLPFIRGISVHEFIPNEGETKVDLNGMCPVVRVDFNLVDVFTNYSLTFLRIRCGWRP